MNHSDVVWNAVVVCAYVVGFQAVVSGVYTVRYKCQYGPNKDLGSLFPIVFVS